MLSWQTRSLAIVVAGAGGNASEELMKFAADLTIDNEEYELFNKGTPVKDTLKQKLPVHATTQDEATAVNYENAADKNNFDMLSLFGVGMQRAAPGQ